MKSRVSILILRPLAEAFRFVAKFENQARWQAATIRNMQLTPGPMAVGAQNRHVGKWLGRNYESVGEVIEYEPDRLWGYKNLSGPYDLVMHYHFESVENGTRLTMDVEGDARGFFGIFKWAEPLVAKAAKRTLEDDLTHLKRVLETGT